MIEFVTGDCMEVMRGYPDGHFNLVFGSPPYEDARTYGIDFNLKGQAWVDWMAAIVKESLRVCKGLVAFVVEGKTRQFRWSATPALLMADLHRAGVHLRKPPAYNRVGIPGSGGPDWLRNDYEFIVCCANGGRLPWSDPTVTGEPCKWKPGGALSYRTADGRRINKMKGADKLARGGKSHSKRDSDETRTQVYLAPALANPGNVLTHIVGGGRMGDRLCHENEAPFPEKLAEFFVRSFCPPGGIVLDPFSGSGTTTSACQQHGRNGVGIDLRESQSDLGRRRCGLPTEAAA